MRTSRHRHQDSRLLRREDGAALVEFALVLPFVLVLALATAEFSKAFNYFTDMTHLAATTARYAAVNKNPGPGATLPDSIVTKALNAELAEGISICLSYPDGDAIGEHVHVVVTYEYVFLPVLGANLPLIGDLPLDGSRTITASADMRLEQIPSGIPAGCSGAV